MQRACRLLLTIAASCVVAAGARELHVAQEHPAAADSSAGGPEAPLRTIAAAVAKARPGDTVYVSNGTYRESVTADNPGPERITLTAAPGHCPIITGADTLPGPFTPVRVALREAAKSALTDTFDAAAWRREIGLDGATAVQAPPATGGDLDHAAAAFLGICKTPLDELCSLVFADGERLDQIGLQGTPGRAEKAGGFSYRTQWDGRDVSDLRPGSFFHDRDRGELYVWLRDGGDPKERRLEYAVRGGIVRLTGTWTLSGFDLIRAADRQFHGGSHAAVVLSGHNAVIENCRILQNEYFGLMHHGTDGVTRDCVIAENGLCGISPSLGWRMLIEGNEFYGNAWRGNVRCGHNGNKITSLKDTRILRNHFHDGHGLWLDINVNNTLVAENLFERCAVGLYFEISCWGVIANNVFRDCGRGIWVYSSNTLVAHNVLDRCGEGITITTMPRGCHFQQKFQDPFRPQPEHCLFATRNNVLANNIVINSTGSYLACNRNSAYGHGNHSDYNAFVWTLPAIHNGANHIKFMAGWDDYYGRLPFWWRATHCDRHSVVADPLLLRAYETDRSWKTIQPPQLVGDPRFVNAAAGDYRLNPDSPLKGRGIRLPMMLDAVYVPTETDTIVTRSLANTEAAPDHRRTFKVGSGTHYRLQPIPELRPLLTMDDLEPDDPGLNATWRRSGTYPTFRRDAEPYWPADWEWAVSPVNRLQNPTFEDGLPADGAWESQGLHAYEQRVCVNFLARQKHDVYGRQTLGPIQPETEYILWAKMHLNVVVTAADAWLGLRAGDTDLGTARVSARPGQYRHWRTYTVRYRSGKNGADAAVGQPLVVTFGAHLTAAAAADAGGPVAFARWDDFFLLTGEQLASPR